MRTRFSLILLTILVTILWTTNGGSTWNPQTSPTTAALKWIDMVDDTRGWAVGTEGTIIRYATEPPTPTPTATATSTPTATPTPQAGTGHLAGTVFHEMFTLTTQRLIIRPFVLDDLDKILNILDLEEGRGDPDQAGSLSRAQRLPG